MKLLFDHQIFSLHQYTVISRHFFAIANRIAKTVDTYVATSPAHSDTKKRNNRLHHYLEVMEIVHRHYGSVPLKWRIAQLYAVWFKVLI
jgi:hypothetical protein